MTKIKLIQLLAVITLILSSCSGYQKILKSRDLDYKYEKAIEFFDNEEYVKAFPLFDELLLLYRGTDKAEEIYYYYCQIEFQKGNYISAAQHFKNFSNTYPDNLKAEECAYMTAYCYYLTSPVYSLDQTETQKAINELNLFAIRYPNSSFQKKCTDLLGQLEGKLDRKSFENAKLYFTTQDYKAAINAFNIAMQGHSASVFKEEMLFLQLKSYYLLASNSVEEKKEKRIKDALIAFNQFKNSYPESKFLGEAKDVFKQTKQLRNQ